MDNPLLADKRVRLALNLAVNKREIIEELFRGIGAAELTVPLPLTLAERNPKLEGYPYDPDKAQKLLKEAGAIGKTITLEAPYNRYTLDREMGEALAGYWEAVGLKVDYKPQDWATYSPRALRGSPAWPTNPFLMGFGDGRFWPTICTICGLPKSLGAAVGPCTPRDRITGTNGYGRSVSWVYRNPDGESYVKLQEESWSMPHGSWYSISRIFTR